MSSLAHCIKVAGIPTVEADKLTAAAKAYRDEGFSAGESNQGAVKDAIAELEAERADILGQVEKQIGKPAKTPDKTPPKKPEKMSGEAKGPDKIGTERPVAGRKVKMTAQAVIGGVDYQLWVSADGDAVVRVVDDDSGEVVSTKTYPDTEMARKEYDDAVRIAKKDEGPEEDSDRMVEGHLQTEDRNDRWWTQIFRARAAAKSAGITNKDVDWTDLEAIVAAVDAYDKGKDKKAETGSLGKNPNGLDVYEDEKGVRSYVEKGLSIQQTVSIIPGKGVEKDSPQALFDKGKTEYLTTDEIKAFQKNKPAAVSPGDRWEKVPGSQAWTSKFGNYLISGRDGAWRLSDESNGQVHGTFTDLGSAATKASNDWIVKQRRPDPEPADIGAIAKLNIPALADEFVKVLEEKEQLNKIGLQGKVADLLGIKRAEMMRDPDYSHKPIEEAFEYAVVKLARKIIAKGKNREQIFNELKALYELQPNLATRTSTSMQNQAYSTPVHLAYLAQEFAGIDKNATAYEPTAGTGMLLTGVSPENGWANEIDETRFEILKDQNFLLSKMDGQKAVGIKDVITRPYKNGPVAKAFDAVLANPPFGSIPTEDIQGFKVSKLEHAIVMDAMKALKDDGKAAFIIGGSNFKNGVMALNQRVFLNWLHRNFNVTANIDIPGDEYGRQGAKFDVRLITLDGRKKTPEGWAPRGTGATEYEAGKPLTPYTKVSTIGQVLEVLKEVENEKNRVASEGTDGQGKRPQGSGPTGDTGGGGEGDNGTELPGPPRTENPGADSAGEGPLPNPEQPPIPGDTGILPAGESDTEGHPGSDGDRHGVDGVPGPDVELPPQGTDDEGNDRVPGSGRAGVPGESKGVRKGAQRPDPGRVPGDSSLDDQLDALSEDDLDSLMSDVANDLDMETIPQPEHPALGDGSPKIKKIPLKIPKVSAQELSRDRRGIGAWLEQRSLTMDRKRKLRKPTTAPKAEIKTPKTEIKKAGIEALDAIKSGFDGLDALFGSPNTLRSGFAFDEDQYQKAKPYFQNMWDHAKQAGYHLKEFVRVVFERYGTRVQPYLKRFLSDLQSENKKKPQKTEDTEFQTVYKPKSNGPIVDETLIPKKMQQSIDEALGSLEKEVGDIDKYVARKLDYKSTPALYKAMSADQIDAVALAINNMDNGMGMIVGDQTGVGKGRVAAAILKYAQLSGEKPIFFTEKPNLFTDFYRDIVDIGHDFDPFVMASDIKLATILDQDGKAVFQPLGLIPRRSNLRRFAAEGKPAFGDTDSIVTTYSQVNRANMQRNALAAVAPGNYVILDESHNASGASSTGEFIRAMIGEAKGVLYLSATFAKRPDTMPVYYRTAMSSTNLTMEQLVAAVEGGGTPLQEIVSSDLASVGQYIRREKSFKGVEVKTNIDDWPGGKDPNRARDERRSDQMTDILRGIVEFDGIVNQVIAAIDGNVQSSGRPASVYGVPVDGATVQGTSTVTASVSTSNFASVVHNAIRQLLFSMKSQTAVEYAIKELKAGRKPIIALANTMGSFLEQQVEGGKIAVGDRLDMTFADVLDRHLRRTLRFAVNQPNGNTTYGEVPVEELPEEAQDKFYEIEANIKRATSDLTGNPIDYIKAELIKAGYVVDEITGRDYVADLSDPYNPILKKRTHAEKSSRNQIIDGFNNGGIDVLIVNSAGATGLSAHSSPKFKDQRPRTYLGVQAELNIDTEVQKMGRINRKGQVNLPKYISLFLDIPAEIRPAAVLIRKMKSLSANTSANADNPLSQKKLPDMMNKYGDHVVRSWLLPKTSQELNALGVNSGDDLTRVSGKMALQPIVAQREFYETIEDEYRMLIDDMKQDGTYDLEVADLDFKAQTQVKEILTSGNDEKNPFGRSTFREELSVVMPKKPYNKKRIEKILKEKLDGKTADEFAQDLVSDLAEKTRAYLLEKQEIMAEEAFLELENQTSRSLAERKRHIEGFLIGNLYRLDGVAGMDGVGAVIIDVRLAKGKGNPVAPSRLRVVFAVDNALQKYTVPMSKMSGRNPTITGYRAGYANDDNYNFKSWDRDLGTDVRQTRYMITGNLLQGYADAPAGSRVVRFTMEGGKIRDGILLPLNYRPSQENTTVRVTADQAVTLARAGYPLMGGVVEIHAGQGRGYPIRVPKSRARGGVYFLDGELRGYTESGDFESVSNTMRATISPESIDKAIARIYALGDNFNVDRRIFQAVITEAETAPAFKFQNRPTSHHGTQSSARLEKRLSKIIDGWQNAPPIRMVQKQSDLPQGILDHVGKKDIVDGVYWQGKVYLVADNLSNPSHAAKTLFHESYGHYGIRGMISSDAKVMAQYIEFEDALLESHSDEIKAIASDYGFNMNTDRGRSMAVEEFLAREASKVEDSGIVNRLIRIISRWIRKVFPDLKVSRGEIKAWLKDARSYVEEAPAEQGQLVAQPAFSESQEAGEPAFSKEAATAPPPRVAFSRQKATPKTVSQIIESDDMGRRERFTRPPAWLAKMYPEFKALFDRQRKRDKDRMKAVAKALEETAGFWELKGEQLDEIRNLIWELESKPLTGLNGVKKLNKVGDVYDLNPEYYEKFAEILEDVPVSQKTKDTFLLIRKSLDADFATVLNKMGEMKDIEQGAIDTYRRQVGNIHNYFPKTRYGGHNVQAIKDGKVVYREHFDLPPAMRLKKKGITAALVKKRIKAVEAMFPGAKVTVSKNQKMPEDVFTIPIPIEAIEAVVNSAVDRLEDADAKKAFRNILPAAVSDALKSRGWGSHTIKRKDIPGYEKEDIQRVLFDYKAGLYGWLTKMETARDFSRTLAKTKAQRKPNLWAAMRSYSYQMLENKTEVDRAVNTARGIMFMKYLGLNFKTAALNLTQNIIAGWPRLGMDVKSHGLILNGAASAITNQIIKGKGLSADEMKLLHELMEDGSTDAQLMAEVRGQIGPNVFSLANKISRVMGWPMAFAETLNRTTLALAAYRAAAGGKVTRKAVLDQYKYDKGEKWAHEPAKQYASEVVDDAHFVYGPGNRPEMFRGDVGKVAAATYTFRSFTHNLMNLWMWMGSQEGGGKAIAKSMAATIVLGGLSSAPLYATILHVARELFGWDPEEWLIDDMVGVENDTLRDLIVYGSPSLLGVDMGGSLGMEVPVLDRMRYGESIMGQVGSNIGSFIGVPWAVLEDVENSARALRSGQVARAAEYLLPTALANPIKAVRLHEEGQHTISGKPINLPGESGPRKITKAEAIGKAVGFQPLSSSKAWDLYTAIEDFRAYRLDKLRNFANRIRSAQVKNDKIEQKKIGEEIKAWNESQKDRPEYIITGDAIVQALSARSRNMQPPVYLRGRADKLMNDRFGEQP